MTPYRVPPESSSLPASRRGSDDLVLGAMLAAVGGLRVVLAIAMDETWGAEASIAAILLALGVLIMLPRQR